MGRIVAKTTRYDGRRTTVDFRLAGALPVQHYSFEVEFRYPGTVGNAIGAGTTNLHGDLSLGGTGFPRRTTARYTLTAVSATDSCRARGVVRPAAR